MGRDPGAGQWHRFRRASYLHRLFQPFSRLHGRSEYEGTGMGLAICRRIAERHGGTITATSAPGKGSTFIVLLPLAPAPGQAEEEKRMSEPRRRVTILVAEDDPDDCVLIEQAFGERSKAGGLEFLRDGEELMDRLHYRGDFADRARFPQPGLVLLDLNMPRKDGREALAEIKGDPGLRGPPRGRAHDLARGGGRASQLPARRQLVHHEAEHVLRARVRHGLPRHLLAERGRAAPRAAAGVADAAHPGAAGRGRRG